MYVCMYHVSTVCEGMVEPYLRDLDVAGGEPARGSILLALPPAPRQGLDDLDPVARLEGQSLLVLVPTEGVQTFTVTPGHLSGPLVVALPSLTQVTPTRPSRRNKNP